MFICTTMNKQSKIIHLLLAIINLMAGVYQIIALNEAHYAWAAAFFLNTFLIVLNVKKKVDITLLFILLFYYLFWSVIRFPKDSLQNGFGFSDDLMVSLLAFLSFISMGYLYMHNRNRW